MDYLLSIYIFLTLKGKVLLIHIRVFRAHLRQSLL